MEIHGFITGELKKKMIIWDDLFENYPEALDMIPNDIILCCWNYDRDVNPPKAHFSSRREEDLLAEYSRKGFNYIFAPAPYLVSNIESFTSYARKYNPLGGLLTVWEKSLNFMAEVFPMVRYAGTLWSGKDTNFDTVMKDLFGIKDTLFINALRCNYEIKAIHPTRLDPLSYLCGPLTDAEALIKSSSEITAGIFTEYLDKCVNTASREMLEDLLVSLEWKKIMYKMRAVAEELFTFGADSPNASRRKLLTAEAAELIDQFLKKKLGQWSRFRNCLSSAGMEKKLVNFKDAVLSLAETSARAAGVLKVKFVLPDMYNAQKSRWQILFEDGSLETVAEGVFKNYELTEACYIYKFPFFTGKKPVSVVIDSWLFGGMGIAYFEIMTADALYVPSNISTVHGLVSNPHNILINDLRFCYMGETDMPRLMAMPELTQPRHGFTVGVMRQPGS